MSDDKLQLTTCDYNAAAADEYATAASAGSHEPTQTLSSYKGAVIEFIELPASSSIDRRLSDSFCVGLSATPDTCVIQPGADPCYCPPQDESVQRHDTASTHCAAKLSDSQQQQQQQPRHQRRTLEIVRRARPISRDTPRWIRCTHRQWCAIAICVVIKIIVVFAVLLIRAQMANSGYD